MADETRAAGRERVRRWFRPPRRLQFTREGKYFVGITFGVGFAAINTGNNLLYLLLGMMLSLIVASGVLSEMSLRGLEVVRTPPSRLSAHRPFLMAISLCNRKRRLPSFSIEVEDLLFDRPLDKKCYFLKLPAGRTQKTSYRHTLPRRGRYQLTALRLSTKFPFGLFRKSRLIELPAEVIVFPAVEPVTLRLPERTRTLGEEARGRRGRRGELFGLHAYREGDDPRDIHWRSSARRGRRMVREHEEESARRVSIFLDNGLSAGAGDDPAAEEALERAVTRAASLGADYLARGYSVRIVARGEPTPPWWSGPAALDRMLRALALLPTVALDTPYPFRPEAESGPILVAAERR